MKHFIFSLAVVIGVMSLCSCNTETNSFVTDTMTSTATISTAQIANTQPSSKTQSEPASVEIEETLLIDESGIKITAKSLDFSNGSGPALNVLIENNSGTDVTVQCRDASVNGYMVDTIMSEKVLNGKKSNTSIIFYKENLKDNNISTIADMEFSFIAFGSELTEKFLENTKVKLQTSAAATYEYTFDNSGDLIYDENNIKIVAKGIASKSHDTCAVVYIENNTDTDWTVQVRNTSVNGFMINPIFSPVITSGKHLIGFIKFSISELAKNSIDEIDEVEASFVFFEKGNALSGFNTDVLKITI